MSMHYWMPLPRQEGSFITSIGGKRCTAVPRNVQPTKAPSPAQPVSSQAPISPSQTPASPVQNTPVTETTPSAANPIAIPITRVSEAPADQSTSNRPALQTDKLLTDSAQDNGAGMSYMRSRSIVY